MYAHRIMSLHPTELILLLIVRPPRINSWREYTGCGKGTKKYQPICRYLGQSFALAWKRFSLTQAGKKSERPGKSRLRGFCVCREHTRYIILTLRWKMPEPRFIKRHKRNAATSYGVDFSLQSLRR